MNKIFSTAVKYRWFLLTLALLFGAVRIYFNATHDFRLGNITHEMPYHPEWEIPPLSPSEQAQVDSILNQKFSYLGKGAQAYAFVSEDQRYVLKFFKFKHLRPSWFMQLLPDIPPFAGWKENEVSRKQKKLDSVFTGYKLAYDLDKQESGLIFIQLNPSNKEKKVTLIDKIGLERTVDLGSVMYVLQEKAETLRAVFGSLLDSGKMAMAKHRIGQVIQMYLSEYKKGIYDRDHGVMHNVGFVGEHPIHLDVGKMSKDEQMKNPEVFEKDLAIVSMKMERWFRENYPEQYPELAQEIKKRISSIDAQ